MKRLSVLLMLLAACTTVPVVYPRRVLVEQTIHPKPGTTHFVSSACEPAGSAACVLRDVEYDLADADVRKRLRDLRFTCDVAGQTYRPAELKPGLIREMITQSCFLFFCADPVTLEIDFIPVTETQKLIDAKTVCESFATYALEDL